MPIDQEYKDFVHAELQALLDGQRAFSEADKQFIQDQMKKLNESRQTPPDSHEKDYLLHLYDQLWENMRAKENRLWAFLGLYGAAVGLVFAAGQTSQTVGADIFALVTLLALSTWAVLIILNANWWYYRNLLMVSGIENRCESMKKGIYPKKFPETKGPFDLLYRWSILVLTTLLIMLYFKTTWSYRNGAAVSTFQTLAGLTIAYLFFSAAALYCLLQHERYIQLLYQTRRGVLERTDTLTNAKTLTFLQNEREDRRKLSARSHVLILLVILAAGFDYVLCSNGLPLKQAIGVVLLQIALLSIYGILWLRYRRPYSTKCFYETLKQVVDEHSTQSNNFIDTATGTLKQNADKQSLNKYLESLDTMSLRDLLTAKEVRLVDTIKNNQQSIAATVKEGIKDDDKPLLVEKLRGLAQALTGIGVEVQKLSKGRDCQATTVADRLSSMLMKLDSFQHKGLLWVLGVIMLASALFPFAYLTNSSTVRADLQRNPSAPSSAEFRRQAEEVEALLNKIKAAQSKLEVIEAQQTQALAIKSEVDKLLHNLVTKQALQEELNKRNGK